MLRRRPKPSRLRPVSGRNRGYASHHLTSVHCARLSHSAFFGFGLGRTVCRAARALLNWSQDELAKAASVGVNTVRNFEQEKASPRPAILSAIRSALERAGVMILDEAGEEGVKRRKAAELPPASNIEPA
ncbi:helix-turn-helix domain-containing protein [Muricoccus vinaceus]|uniref:Multiprotein-bridging factor 1 family protein n=1 Tax=Muricoccus vinaceus TaxID=424704 RepID=A0ABV6IUH3_9PROT